MKSTSTRGTALCALLFRIVRVQQNVVLPESVVPEIQSETWKEKDPPFWINKEQQTLKMLLKETQKDCVGKKDLKCHCNCSRQVWKYAKIFLS